MTENFISTETMKGWGMTALLLVGKILSLKIILNFFPLKLDLFAIFPISTIFLVHF